jgi:putative spermidine/putrescine transport system permease protein
MSERKALGPLPTATDDQTGGLDAPDDIPRAVWVATVVVFIYLLTPAGVVVLTSLNPGDYLTFPPQGLSARWILHFFEQGTFLPAYLVSLQLGLLTAVASTLVGTITALGLARTNFRGRTVLQTLLLSPLTLPGLVLSLGLLIYYHSIAASGLPSLVGSFAGLWLAHVLVATPYVVRTVTAALTGFDQSLEEAARSLGAGPLAAFMRVTLPIIRPGIAAGALFALIVSFGAFDVSLFLATPNEAPLPIAMFNYLRWRHDPTPAAAGTFAILLVTVGLLVSSRLVRLGRVVGFD